MKAILKKLNNSYILLLNDVLFASDNNSLHNKLSKKNCDEIFGVVDVEELAYEYWNKDREVNDNESFVEGFNKAMELNKDKQFTVEQMKKAIDKARQGSVKWVERYEGDSEQARFVLDNLSYDEIIKPLQQQTEWEVEIVQEEGKDTFGNAELTWYNPKLDADGCLILKRAE